MISSVRVMCVVPLAGRARSRSTLEAGVTNPSRLLLNQSGEWPEDTGSQVERRRRSPSVNTNEVANICDRQQKNDSCGCGPVHDGVFSPKRRRPAAKLSHPKQSLECAAT